MIRTKCCESYKCGDRCSICPHRPENREAVRMLKVQLHAQPQPRQTSVPPVLNLPTPVSRIRHHATHSS